MSSQTLDPSTAARDQEASVPPPIRKRSWLRTTLTLLLLVIFLCLIGGYAYITDSDRVRDYAQRYLTALTGAHITIGHASLSIFEGLRLDDLKMTSEGGELFDAKSVQVDYDPHALLHGRIDAGRVLAVEPHIRLIEDVDRREWNFQQLYRRNAAQSPANRFQPSPPRQLPQIIVRNAQVDYAQTIGGKTTNVGTLHLEGQFAPDAQGDYRFTLQSRVGTKGTFPVAEGWMKPDASRLSVELRDVDFVNEVKTILPAHVREFWEEHALAGRMNRTRLDYAQLPGGQTAFTVVTDLAGVDLTVPPANWMDQSDRDRVQRWRDNFGEVAGPAMGGSAIAGSLLDAMVPQPLHLRSVDATFVFTDDRIRIRNLVGRLDQNRVRVTGDIDGYTANAGFSIRIESLPSRPLALAESPAFIPSMPWPVQELYYRFRPKGTASFYMNVSRGAGQAKTSLNGELNVHDAAFVFDRFPYPADRASGTLRFSNDPATGDPLLEIVSMKCHGYRGGPNADANVEITGRVTPLDMAAGADIRIAGTGLVSDDRLIEAMPPPTRKAVRNFDSAHTGQLPRFAGDFDCRVHREVGTGKPWLVTTKLDIRDGEGSFVGFPYLVKDVSGSLTIFDDHLELSDIKLPCDGGAATLTGAITWQKHDRVTGAPLVQTDLTLQARHVALNDRLLDALPKEKSAWLRKVALAGNVDLDGKIVPSAPDSDDPSVFLNFSLSDGSARLLNGAAEVAGLRATGKVDPNRAVIEQLHGRYGTADVDGSGTVIWSGAEPQLSAAAKVSGLAVDSGLLKILPEGAAKIVESLHAKGMIDAAFSYDASTNNAYRIQLTPRQLTLRPDFFPIELTKLGGSVRLEPGRVTLQSVTARAGDSTLSASGTIDTASGDGTLALAGRDLVLNDALDQALPAGLRDLVKAAALQGKLSFDCPKLVVRGLASPTQSAGGADVDFDTKAWFSPVDLTLGVPFRDVRGTVQLAGTIRQGNLQSANGQLNLDSLKIAGRPVTGLSTEMHKVADRNVMELSTIDGKIAGGNVAGQIETSLTKTDPRFALNLQVRGVRITELTGDLTNPIDGKLTASLAMEGRWSDTAGRHGRGDVQVDGKNMYRVPVVFGLMQVANLALPNDTPIQQAALRYTIEGPRLIMDQIDLRATESVMQGSGEINFDSKQVDMRLSLANSAADALPIFGDLIKAARQDLLQIRVRGTLQAPKVQASAFNIFSTTVDDVQHER